MYERLEQDYFELKEENTE